MILVDTSIWINHLRAADINLVGLLRTQNVLTHPFIVGELAMGNLPHREAFLAELQSLPKSPVATDAEVMTFIDYHGLAGHGIGYIDAHLLASTRLRPGSFLWTADNRLRQVAGNLGLSSVP